MIFCLKCLRENDVNFKYFERIVLYLFMNRIVFTEVLILIWSATVTNKYLLIYVGVKWLVVDLLHKNNSGSLNDVFKLTKIPYFDTCTIWQHFCGVGSHHVIPTILENLLRIPHSIVFHCLRQLIKTVVLSIHFSMFIICL